MSFKIDLETQVSHKGTYKVPDELAEVYIIYKTGWTLDTVRNTPFHIIEKLKLLWHLDNMQKEYINRKTNSS